MNKEPEKWIIDRFERDFAVCERPDKSTMDVLIDLIPNGAREGDVLLVGAEGFVLERTETKKREKRIKQKAEALWEEE